MPTDTNGPAGEERLRLTMVPFVHHSSRDRRIFTARNPRPHPQLPASARAANAFEFGLEPIDGSNSRLRRHSLGGHDHNSTAIFEDQLPLIVQKIVHLRIRRVVELNPPGHGVMFDVDWADGLVLTQLIPLSPMVIGMPTQQPVMRCHECYAIGHFKAHTGDSHGTSRWRNGQCAEFLQRDGMMLKHSDPVC